MKRYKRSIFNMLEHNKDGEWVKFQDHKDEAAEWEEYSDELFENRKELIDEIYKKDLSYIDKARRLGDWIAWLSIALAISIGITITHYI